MRKKSGSFSCIFSANNSYFSIKETNVLYFCLKQPFDDNLQINKQNFLILSFFVALLEKCCWKDTAGF